MGAGQVFGNRISNHTFVRRMREEGPPQRVKQCAFQDQGNEDFASKGSSLEPTPER